MVDAMLVVAKPTGSICVLVVGKILGLVDIIDARISEQRSTQLVPGALVIESPSRMVCPASSVASASLVTTLPEPRVRVEFHAKVWPSMRYLSPEMVFIDILGSTGGVAVTPGPDMKDRPSLLLPTWLMPGLVSLCSLSIISELARVYADDRILVSILVSSIVLREISKEVSESRCWDDGSIAALSERPVVLVRRASVSIVVVVIGVGETMPCGLAIVARASVVFDVEPEAPIVARVSFSGEPTLKLVEVIVTSWRAPGGT